MKTLRKERAWTQEDLASRAGYSPENIKKLETLRTWVSTDGIERLAAAFGVPEERLFQAGGVVPEMKYETEMGEWTLALGRLEEENLVLRRALQSVITPFQRDILDRFPVAPAPAAERVLELVPDLLALDHAEAALARDFVRALLSRRAGNGGAPGALRAK